MKKQIGIFFFILLISGASLHPLADALELWSFQFSETGVVTKHSHHHQPHDHDHEHSEDDQDCPHLCVCHIFGAFLIQHTPLILNKQEPRKQLLIPRVKLANFYDYAFSIWEPPIA